MSYRGRRQSLEDIAALQWDDAKIPRGLPLRQSGKKDCSQILWIPLYCSIAYIIHYTLYKFTCSSVSQDYTMFITCDVLLWSLIAHLIAAPIIAIVGMICVVSSW